MNEVLLYMLTSYAIARYTCGDMYARTPLRMDSDRGGITYYEWNFVAWGTRVETRGRLAGGRAHRGGDSRGARHVVLAVPAHAHEMRGAVEYTLYFMER